jgi:hypothetical protein
MAYVPDWERLPDALSRVMAAGLCKSEAQRGICRAIVDLKIRARFVAEKAEIPDANWVGAFAGCRVVVPRDLGPRDFDWRKSRPKKPWQHGDHPFVRVHLTLIELFSADVTPLLCGGKNGAESSTESNLHAQPRRSRGKNRPAVERAHGSIGEATFDPNEWITVGEAAEILRLERDSSDTGSRWRLIELLRRQPSVARIITATLPPRANTNGGPSGLMPLPDRCVWAGVDEINWATSTVRVFPLFSGTDREDWYPRDHMLGIRVSRTAVIDNAQLERDAEERSRASRHDVAARLFAELFWPVPRVVAWIGFRTPDMIEADWRAAILYDKSPIGQSLKDRHPQGTLLRRLQEGRLRALRDGNELAREKWANATGREWPDDIRFRREDVLALWPAEREQTPEAQISRTRPRSLKELEALPTSELRRLREVPRDPAIFAVWGRERALAMRILLKRDQVQSTAPPRTSPLLPSDLTDVRTHARIWRANRIERFTMRQRRLREWINFAEIADWCSREDGSIVPNEQKRRAAFDTLQNDLLSGEFEENGRSRVLICIQARLEPA